MPVFATPLEVKSRLAQLGLNAEIFIRAAQRGFVERAAASPYDPTTAPGTDAWRYTVRDVRQRLDTPGDDWRMDNPQNLPLIISDKRKLNIAVSSGNDFTGIQGCPVAEPKSKNPKGAMVKEAVKRNIDQIDLFPELQTEAVRKFRETVGYPTWVFLIYITDEIIRAELSLPKSFDDSTSQLDGWEERIIMTVPLPDDADASDIAYDSGDDITPIIKTKI